MDVFKCNYCGTTEFGGFSFDVEDEEGKVYPVNVCVNCVAKIAKEHGVFEREDMLKVFNKVKDTIEVKGGSGDDSR